MNGESENKINHFISFALGVSLAFTVLPALDFFKEFTFGFEIHSAASYPYFHNAKIRTRPGFGDQTLFLEVDEVDVWRSGDMSPGDLDEELSWDASGTIVTLKLQNQPFIRYDTESESLVEIECEESVE